MRTINSAKNLASSLGITLIMTLLGFFTRKVFVDEVGIEYLGLNGLLQNILGIMTLLEGGFAAGVVYNLYKPLAEDDRPKIIALLQLYKKVYRLIAIGIVVFALLLYPFIDHFIKDVESLEYVSFVYFIFLFNSIVGYFTAYKWSLINASQLNYKLTTINLSYQIGLNLAKLSILFFTANYILYLIVEALFGIALNVGIVKKANKLFPYINTKAKYKIAEDTKQNIISNMKSLFLNNMGTYFMHSTDNIVISSFVGVASIGLYSNYTLITQTIGNVVTQIFNSFTEGVGNLIASEETEKIYEVFKTTYFIGFLLAIIPSIVLFNTLEPFISWWLGDSYELGYNILSVVVINFYISTMRTVPMIFKVKAGLFYFDRFAPLFQGVINIILSLIFVQFWGLTGVLFATTISILSVGFWQYPFLCYKYIFKRRLTQYFKKYLFYTIIWISSLLLSLLINSAIDVSNNFLKILFNGSISLLVTCFMIFVAFRKTDEYIDTYSRLVLIINSIRN